MTSLFRLSLVLSMSYQPPKRLTYAQPVMAGLVPAIPTSSVAASDCNFRNAGARGDARDRPGHDGWGVRQSFGRLVVRRETDKE